MVWRDAKSPSLKNLINRCVASQSNIFESLKLNFGLMNRLFALNKSFQVQILASQNKNMKRLVNSKVKVALAMATI